MASNLSAIELLNLGDDDRVQPVLNQYWPQIMGVFFGVGTGCMINFGTRRPMLSGLQKHILSTAVWTGLLTLAQKKRNEYFAERDAIYRHYIQLHPEDFPVPEKKKIGDILEKWIPVR